MFCLHCFWPVGIGKNVIYSGVQTVYFHTWSISINSVHDTMPIESNDDEVLSHYDKLPVKLKTLNFLRMFVNLKLKIAFEQFPAL